MPKKILIIEDDANVMHSLGAQFRVGGFEVSFSDGTDFIGSLIAKIKVDKPDYIVLDLVLPNMDGFELLNRIKADEDIFITPVFVFSDMSDADVRARCHNLGADYYFLKEELNIDEFVAKVKKIIQNRSKLND
ncbi:response regulator [Candidatus Parcubacteria bacterium]|nr:response regulator [Patescibacteria group bacterium]MBU4309194.1 response regulator [Patescibacteria group bacterium]MBU4432642.1 response regulator [Patescibacteria group bacterium]MBU4577555.1 response regulator [Patescibacteria group bacterium]MCG2697242.1 response regulator [Candidatus Parcubacteria bacterium]